MFLIYIYLSFFLTLIFLFASGHSGASENDCSECAFYEHSSSHHDLALKKLKPLCKMRFTTDTGLFKYRLGICININATDDGGRFINAGALQIDNGKQIKILGSIKKADVTFGDNWIMLRYDDGDAYPSHCNQTKRQVHIMITCDKNENQGKLIFLEETDVKFDECYYMFELHHKIVCSDDVPTYYSDELSSGSIICISLISLAIAYLIIGFMFMRFVRKAKGFKQIPNLDFWKELGNLQADGCEFVCRSKQEFNYSQDLQQDFGDRPDDGILRP